jgi:Bacterial Ig-like domain (group 2)
VAAKRALTSVGADLTKDDVMMHRHARAGLFAGLLATFAVARCDKPLAPTTNVTPRLLSLNISGNTSMSAIGETSQLTASAAYTDGTIKDVSNTVRWESQIPAVATVSPSGLLTATGFGRTLIVADLLPGFARSVADVRVLLPGTFIVSGRVREPGFGSVGGVRIAETPPGLFTTSTPSGNYSLVGVKTLRLTFEKEGYETAVSDASPDGVDDVPVQRVLRIAAGGSVQTLLAPHDLTYVVAPGISCSPCRLIRVVAPSAGVLNLRLTWSSPSVRLVLWIDGRRFVQSDEASHEIGAEVRTAAGEFVVYASSGTKIDIEHVPITLTALPM